jgi:hypothetical protein
VEEILDLYTQDWIIAKKGMKKNGMRKKEK